MAVNKSNLFSQKQQDLAELFKALGHPARIAIMDILSRKPHCMCGNITDELPLAQSTVSQHLKALKNAGLIKGEIEGPRMCYCLSEYGSIQFSQLISPIIEQNKTTKTHCC